MASVADSSACDARKSAGLEVAPCVQFATAPSMVLHTRVVVGAGGGPDKTILNSPQYLVGTDYEAHCAYLHPPRDPGFDALRQRAADCGAPLHSIPDCGFWDLSVVRKLLRLCRELDVKVWHAHDYKSNLLGLLLRPFHPMHLVTTVHGWGVQNTRRTNLYYWIDRRCLPHYDCVICVSENLADIARRCGVADERCVLIENGIDSAAFTRTMTTEEAKRRLGFNQVRPLIGAVGRLSEEKGFDVLIDAVGKLHDSGIDVDLAIAGDGHARPALEAQIGAQSHPERFYLLGFQPDCRTLYQAMDVFALSSRREGLPNVLLEAMSLETPVVATAIAGIPRLITDGTNGLLVPPENVAELQRAITTLVGQRDFRERLGREGRQTIVARYDFAGRMKKVRAVYDGLCRRP